MNDDNKDDDLRSLSSRLGNGSKQMRRECNRHAHNNHTDHAEGGVVGDDNDDDDDDDDDNDANDANDDDGGCGGQDGHQRMRKGRGHDDRRNATIK